MAAQHLRNGTPRGDGKFAAYTLDNYKAWEAMAGEWESFQTPVGASGKPDDGNDMFTQCLLPEVDDLAEWKQGESVLDLGAGSGIIARRFAKQGAHVTGLDFSEAMIQKGRERTKDALPGSVDYDFIDLMDLEDMRAYMDRREDLPDGGKFDIITISTTLKSLPDLEPVAAALPLMLKPGGRIVIVDLHPVFSKPAGHRGMEIYEDPNTGKQLLDTYIKIPRYLDVPPSKSEAVRGQPEPLVSHNLFEQSRSKLIQGVAVGVSQTDALASPALFQQRPGARCYARAGFQGRAGSLSGTIVSQLSADAYVAGIPVTAPRLKVNV